MLKPIFSPYWKAVLQGNRSDMLIAVTVFSDCKHNLNPHMRLEAKQALNSTEYHKRSHGDTEIRRYNPRGTELQRTWGDIKDWTAEQLDSWIDMLLSSAALQAAPVSPDGV
jgi:hypothetical protein